MSHRVDRKSTLCKQNHCNSRTSSRWSEPILRRRSALADSDSTSEREDTDSPPPPEDLLPQTPSAPTSILKHSSCCCSSRSNQPQRNHCCPYTTDKEKSKECTERKIMKENEMREQLEEKICKNEVEDSIAADQQDILQYRLNRMDSLLQALGAYTNCLYLLDKAATRLRKLTIGFANKDLDPSINIQENLQTDAETSDKVTNVKSIISISLMGSDEINEMLDNHKKKKNDFALASNNFSQFLHSGTRATLSQLRKLDQQYDTIQLKYQNSNMVLNQELPKIIEDRLKTISKCFTELTPVSDEIYEKEAQLTSLLKEINNILLEKNNIISRNINKKHYAKNYSPVNEDKTLHQKGSKQSINH